MFRLLSGCLFLVWLGGFVAVAEDSLPPEVAPLRRDYEAKVKAEVAEAWSAAELDLGVKYAEALKRAQEAAQQRGNLEEALAVAGERDRLAKGGAVPDRDETGTHSVLVDLRATYRQSRETMEADAKARLAPLRTDYLRALDDLTRQLTQANRLDEAVKVRALADAERQGPVTMAMILGQDHKAGEGEGKLTEALGSGRWQWNGSPRFPMIFRQDGTIGMEDWERKGLVTRWKVTGPATVMLEVTKGRDANLTALLEFAEDFASFRGRDFDGKELKPSLRID
ncbi:MAG: hypothetical protein KDM64_01770 [Verrucomicrobiae bacterium]|nr:hypothetical protein [Verrucomicrobiae bacterium]